VGQLVSNGDPTRSEKLRMLPITLLGLKPRPSGTGCSGRPPAASAGALPLTSSYGINNLSSSISGPSADLCRIVAKESTRCNRAVLQVVENKDQQSGGSTEPKAVSDLRPKSPVFKCLRFNEMRPSC
jgi:hypothetical protein